MKNTSNSKIILVALAVVLVFGVIAIAPENANAGYGYNDYGGNYSGYSDFGSNFYGSGSYYGGMYIQGLSGPQSPWYPSIVVPVESQRFFMEQTWRRYGFKSSDLNYDSGSNYNSNYHSDSYYSTSNFNSIGRGYGY